MFIAHLPAGYLVTGRLTSTNRVLVAGLVGSVLPDIDMLRFCFIDHGHRHHHSYFTHFPLFWIACLVVAALLPRANATRAPALSLAANAMLHMVLDTVAGDMRWLAPFSDRAFSLVSVPATHGSWIASYLTHWTFAVEVAITAVALAVWWRRFSGATTDAGRPRPESAAVHPRADDLDP